MAPVTTRTYDSVHLPGSARASRVLVAAVGQDIHRERLQLLNQQLVGDAAYTKPTSIYNGGGVTQPASVGGSNVYGATQEPSDQKAHKAASAEHVGLKGLSSGSDKVGASERGAPPEEDAKPTSAKK